MYFTALRGAADARDMAPVDYQDIQSRMLIHRLEMKHIVT